LAAAGDAILLLSMAVPSSHLDQDKLEFEPDRPDRNKLDRRFLRRKKRPIEVGDDFEIVDLFSGCGGMTIGAIEGARRMGRQAGLARAVDNNPLPLEVLKHSLGVPDRCIADADLTEALAAVGGSSTSGERSLFAGITNGGLLLAGPPCQGHSALNNHTRHDDPRNDLYVAVGRVARILEPQAVIIENVRTVSSDRRGSVATCISILEEDGYHVGARRLDLSTLGVPQRRVRHVVVATRDQSFDWDLPAVSVRDLRWAIKDLLPLEGSTRIDSPSKPTELNRERMEWLIANDEYDLPDERRPICHQSDHSYRSMYGRLRWDAPAQTITSGFGSMGQGRYVHPEKPRTLTPHEAARLQCLPDFVALGRVGNRGKLAQMIGNVAPPLLTTILVERLIAQKLL
jgi:DNA (cytosine-5)-methyltransferase 1